MSIFGKIDLLPYDPILSLTSLFAKDPRPNKVNLGVGIYNDKYGKVPVFDAVKQAELQISKLPIDKNYLPIDGLSDYLERGKELIFNLPKNSTGPLSIYAAQTIGGTGALKVGAEFLRQNCSRNIYISNPSWPNHRSIFESSGLKVHLYSYYDVKKECFLFKELCDEIDKMSPGSVILLQVCCHNPLGFDFSENEWREIAQRIKRSRVIPFFDFAYQGFGTGLNEDAFSVRHFYAEGIEMLVAYSFSKNMGLYGERVGLLAIAGVDDGHHLEAIGSQVRQIIRGTYSMPPLHGALVAKTILSDKALTENWQAELKTMQQRIVEMHKAFAEGLTAKAGIDLSLLKNHRGLFSCCGLDQKQVLRLRDEYAIYLPVSGRINVAGLNHNNIGPVTTAIADVMKP
jgi:aspartate/tyrosine/aromatic aminotransferase